MAMRSIAIVGASLAGFRMAEELRRSGYDGALTLIGGEPHFPPVDRPPLSKQFLVGDVDADSFSLSTSVDLDAQILAGQRAIALSPDQHSLLTSAGVRLHFDGLGIATGSTPRTLRCPGARLDGVVSLRTVEDAVELRARLVRPGSRVVVVGAGFIGCEVAASCRALGAEVTLVEAADRMMSRSLGPLGSQGMAELQRSYGVDVRLGVGVHEVIGSSKVTGVRLVHGEILPADIVVVGIGSTPETSWLDLSGLPIEDGVVCDAALAVVGADHIVAAGDVARWFHAGYGTRMRVEHWTNAIEQAQHAARTLLAGYSADPYVAVPYFWSDQYDRKVQFVGVIGEEEELIEGSFESGRAVVEYRRGGEVVGALCIGSPRHLLRYRSRLTATLKSASEKIHSGTTA